jgi:hypothetical protein
MISKVSDEHQFITARKRFRKSIPSSIEISERFDLIYLIGDKPVNEHTPGPLTIDGD